MSAQSDDINDIFDGLREDRQQEVVSISNDSPLGSSLSNFGIDRNNPEENERYIQQNQEPMMVIQGIGAAVENPRSENDDSGLPTSISKTMSSEFVPEVIEIQEDILETNSGLIATVEPQPGTSSGERYGYDPKYDESEKLAENLQDLDISSFDLALGKGYYEQAKIYYDDSTSKGLNPKTKYVKPLKDIASQEVLKDIVVEQGPSALEEDYFSEGYAIQLIFNLRKDFEEYLENLQKKRYRKVLEQLNYKKKLNNDEKQIKKNIGTKTNRNNLALQSKTIEIIRNFLKRLNELENFIKKDFKKQHDDVSKQN